MKGPVTSGGRAAAAVVTGSLVVLFATEAAAYKRRFEPTDLELEEAGMLQADVQLGFLQSDGPGRLVLPDAELDLGRPVGAVAGLDAEYELNDQFAILGAVGTVIYFSGDPHELEGALGLQWSPTETLDVSMMGLVGLPPGSDRYGVLVGAARKFQLWK